MWKNNSWTSLSFPIIFTTLLLVDFDCFFDCFVNNFGLGDSSQREAEPLFSCCREADLFAGLDL